MFMETQEKQLKKEEIYEKIVFSSFYTIVMLNNVAKMLFQMKEMTIRIHTAYIHILLQNLCHW